ncbi:MAG TPA: tripartite tricarboxylate transporter substrate binding protein [Ramlibacter sp.]|nr:tripartite tricarboxylate transporter substrate binding protein [Ramlibacter sp.]
MDRTTLTRRSFAGTVAALPWALAAAQPAYPSGPIHIIVPYPAGGATDTLARLVAQDLQATWSTPVVVENKPGGSGNIGGQLVAKAAPDGRTVLMGITALAQLPSLMTMPFDPLKDLAPLVEVARSQSLLVVPADSLASDMRQFVALAKANPRKYSYGSYGNGTSSHLQGELFKLQTGVDIVHVPYKGSAQLITDLLGGQVSASFVDSGSIAAHLKSGKLKILAVTGNRRSPLVPDVQTMTELGFKDFEPMGWFGMFMPAGTPAAVVNKFAAAAARIVRQPQAQARIQGLGLIPVGNTPPEFARTVRSDSALYGRIIKAANIRIE